MITTKTSLDVSPKQIIDKKLYVSFKQYFVHYFIFLIGWIVLRIIDFWSGFVEYSLIRITISLLLPLLSLTFFYLYESRDDIRSSLLKASITLGKLNKTKRFILIQIALLALLGFIIFLTRDMRGATSSDTEFFRQSVESTAHFQGLLYNDLVGSQLRAHSNFFLFLMVPIVWLFGGSGWILIQYLHSMAISAWAYLIGRNITRKKQPYYALSATFVAVGLFLAVYYQNSNFYDTRFAALALVTFLVGWLQNNKTLSVVGFLAVLFTRETSVISLMLMVPFLPSRKSMYRMRWFFFVVAILWLGIYALVIQSLGGASGTGRIDECVTAVSFSDSYLNCLYTNVGTNLPLKIAYTIRLISFAPLSVLSLGAMMGIAPELGLGWISQDYVFFSLNWHYYMPLLGIILLLGFHQMNLRVMSNRLRQMFLLWTVCTGLWQFMTTVRPELF